MHLSRLPERSQGERDREEEDDRAPQALLLSDSESDERLRRLRRDLRSPPAPVGLFAVGNPVGGSWGAEAVTGGRTVRERLRRRLSARSFCISPRARVRERGSLKRARPRSCNDSLGTFAAPPREAGVLAQGKNNVSLNERTNE